jgi:tetratricopeptide (TPR) repeat protein
MTPSRCVSLMLVAALCLSGLWPRTLFARGTTLDQTILRYQRLLQHNPGDAKTYYRLGDAYIQQARERGDVTYFTLAEQALRKALDIAPHQSGAVRHLAYVLYSRHAFQEAAVHAAKAVALDPADSHAYGILGDAYQEVGKYEQAREAYQQMIALQGDLYAYSRLSGLKSLRGDPQGAIADLERAIREGVASGRPREAIAWAQWQLGSEYFAIGDLQAAEAQYRDALHTYPNYYRALAGLGQVRAAQKRYPEAVDCYQQALAVIPLPEYAAALGDVYLQSGRPEEATKQYALVEYIGQLNTLNQVLYNRELASFYADHDVKLEKALELARKELEVRQDIYAYDVLAWALYKNGHTQEALAPMTEALKLGTKDARLFFHAAMIYHRLGETDRARAYLQRALSTNPYFHIRYAEVAERTLAEIDGRSGSPGIQEPPNAR